MHFYSLSFIRYMPRSVFHVILAAIPSPDRTLSKGVVSAVDEVVRLRSLNVPDVRLQVRFNRF